MMAHAGDTLANLGPRPANSPRGPASLSTCRGPEGQTCRGIVDQPAEPRHVPTHPLTHSLTRAPINRNPGGDRSSAQSEPSSRAAGLGHTWRPVASVDGTAPLPARDPPKRKACWRVLITSNGVVRAAAKAPDTAPAAKLTLNVYRMSFAAAPVTCRANGAPDVRVLWQQALPKPLLGSMGVQQNTQAHPSPPKVRRTA
jgi:hypothetical protein